MNPTYLLLLAILILSAPLASAQPCRTNADADCDGQVDITEVTDYINTWYGCSACAPDLLGAINAFYQSSCPTDCTGKQCGDDGCGGSCPPGCATGYYCDEGSCAELTENIIFVDNRLTDDCTDAYSIAYRNCNGSDGDAFNTVQEAATAAAAGDAIYLREGAYPQTAQILIQNKAGTGPSAKITFAGFGSEEAVISGPGSPAFNGISVTNSSYVALNGLRITGFGGSGIVYDRSPYGEIRNVLVENSGGSGIMVSLSNRADIEGATVANSRSHGIYSAESDYTNVTHSLIRDNAGAGIYFRGSSNGTMDRNEIYNNSIGISTVWRDTNQHTSTYNLVSNNLIYNHSSNPEGADGIGIGSGSTHNTVIGNIVIGNYDDGIDASTGGGATGNASNLYERIMDNIAFANGDGPEVTSTAAPGYWEPCRQGKGICRYNATSGLCHYGCGDGNGIKVSTNNGGGHLVAGNVAFGNERGGFDQDKAQGFPQNYFYNNIAYNNSATGGFIMDAPSLPQNEDAVLYNNIGSNNAGRDLFRSNELAVNISDYNLWRDGYNVSGMDAHSLSGDPMFNDSGLAIDTDFMAGWTIDQKLEHIRSQVRRKFSLQAASTAINAGTVIPGYHCTTPGPHPGEGCREWHGSAPDMGAYEYVPGQETATTTSNITQYGITWHFDGEHEYGQFANGDYWILGPVDITSITPEFDGQRNGWEVNPKSTYQQGFDGRASNFNASLVPALPYTAKPNMSIVKAVGVTDGNTRTYVQTAAVLTVIGSAPPDGGAGTFRPPYFGNAKPLYPASGLRLDLLPSLAPVPSAPTLAWAEERFRMVHINHVSDWSGDQIQPVDNFQLDNPYGAEVARDAADAVLRMMLNDTASDKQRSVVYLTQAGIDYYHMALGGTRWPANGGHGNGEKLPLAFAAVMLDSQEIMNYLMNVPHGGAPLFNDVFGEDGMLYRGANGEVLFGQIHPWCTESWYWQDMSTDSQGVCRDPYGIIDGGHKPTNKDYQTCCNSMPWKYTALSLMLMPGLRQAWSNDQIIEYSDRWVTRGALGQPDPCAPISQGGGPDGNGRCILDPDLAPGSTFANFSCQAGKQCGRFPEMEGSNRNSGYYSSGFGDMMWNAYRNLSVI